VAEDVPETREYRPQDEEIHPYDPLYPGTEFRRRYWPGIYRFRISDCDGNVLDEQWGVEFRLGEEFRWEISH